MSNTHCPSWLTAAVDQRLALINDIKKSSPLPGFDIIIVQLTHPPDDVTPEQFEVWDHSCDNCGKLCENDLRTGHYQASVDGQKVAVTFGCCTSCAELP